MITSSKDTSMQNLKPLINVAPFIDREEEMEFLESCFAE